MCACVRVCFISFHLDHCGALPWFLQKTSFKGRTFMTHATKAIYRWLLSDYVKVRWEPPSNQDPHCYIRSGPSSSSET